MFVARGRGGYTRDGSQWAAGDFLIVFDDETGAKVSLDNGRHAPALLACVRYARMSQLGHWMMARVRIGEHTVSLSGAYGGDGLPAHYPGWPSEPIPATLRSYLHSVPVDLARQYWQGGGHNTSGVEAPAMREWARANLATLRSRRKEATVGS